ncbi:hypothetical protein [Croceicoccus sp. YJ47]|uniref:DUF6950 family protein n=1 Tax=Croceicoccus sp. YJ47 TaxID=2798724 RepID=UPI0019208B77|nr:hypothetical protein [Croceicoccus sp. YJ47]QQN73959.1 hypothetical protein JD971_14615 [Croceicoccus sp. YJ47]
MNELLRRKEAVEKTLAKYRDKPFDWRRGQTCLHMLRFHLRLMGHAPEPLPRVRSAIGARRALNLRGWQDVGDMLDAMLPRIAPAAMLLGDVASFRSDDGFGAITINLGGKVMGWHEDAPGMTALEPVEIAGAWRV